MVETLKIAITGANILPTILFGLVLLYWLTMIVGVLDLDFLDFGVDADVDTSGDGGDVGTDPGAFHSLLIFLNMDRVPFMIVMSVLIFAFWTLAMISNILPVQKGGLIIMVLFVPAFFVSALFAKVVTMPLKNFFGKVKADMDTGAETVGQLCTLLSDVEGPRLGQAEFTSVGKHVVINVRCAPGKKFAKGDQALVLSKEDDGIVYIIDSFNEWE
ncbi:YqiJ family protein [Myxococcota bacterium]|nr:YqiJ family protein [Myxococcota bacterium]